MNNPIIDPIYCIVKNPILAKLQFIKIRERFSANIKYLWPLMEAIQLNNLILLCQLNKGSQTVNLNNGNNYFGLTSLMVLNFHHSLLELSKIQSDNIQFSVLLETQASQINHFKREDSKFVSNFLFCFNIDI